MTDRGKKIKLAFVTQPWDGVGMGSSIGIITCQSVVRLTNEYEVFIFAKSGKCKFIEQGEVNYKYISLKVDTLFIKVFRLIEKVGLLSKSKKPLFSRSIYHIIYSLRAALSIRKNKIDIVHIHNYSQFAKVIRLLNPQAKILLHMHCEWLTQLNRKMIEKRLSKIDLVVGCSGYITDKIKNRFTTHAAKCFTFENGVDVNRFMPLESSNEKNKNSIKILFVGRVSPEKGVHILLKVFEKLYQENREIKLDIVGPIKSAPYNLIVGLTDDEKIKELKQFYKNTDYFTQLKKMISENTNEAVNFHGGMDSPKLSLLYQTTDIVVNPSYSESFGMSVIEAMACGKPVIASKVGGMVEIIEKSRSGILFEAGNEDDLYYALKKLIENEQYRNELSAGSRQYAVEYYSWDKTVGKLNQIYRND